MKILISACLMGKNCKYNGRNNYNPKVDEFLTGEEIIMICPKMLLAELGIPRNCAEIANGKVIDIMGKDVDKDYCRCVDLALRKVQNEQIGLVILQSRSPTCGVHQIYDGSFSGTLISRLRIIRKYAYQQGI